MKPALTLLIALLLIGGIGLFDTACAIACMIVIFIFAIIQLVLMCKELNRNRFGKKSEL